MKRGKTIKVLAKTYWALIMGIIAGLILGIFLSPPVVAEAPPPDNVRLVMPSKPEIKPPVAAQKPQKKAIGGSHGIKANNTISEATLAEYLRKNNSPLADYAGEILKSPYWSTIIGICTIEELKCSINPHSSNNFWGLGPGIRYPSIPAGLEAINAFLAKAETKHPTIESLNGWYNQPGSANWLNTVVSTKLKLESL